jgi:ribonuclease R
VTRPPRGRPARADRAGGPGSNGKPAASDGRGRARPSKAQPAATVVAVIEKRGKFWAAEPHFPAPRADGDGRGSRGPRRIALASNCVAGPAGGTARTGDLVLVQIAGRGAGARASIARVLGRPDVARDAIEALMLDRGLARAFDPDVEREAETARDRVRERARAEVADGRRRDLRDLPTFTIDPASARDFDDAISAERLEDGGVRLWVHIADVAAHVPPDSLVDVQARARGTSVYVPGAVEPMLPEALSNDGCSLVPGADRPAVTVELELHGATVSKAAFHRSLIRSDERLSYEQADEIFAGRDRGAEPWATPLEVARAAAAALGEARLVHRGALTLDAAEPEFVLDADGHVSEVLMRTQTESHRLIEQLMIAANEAVARLLSERSTPCLYRVHERPAPERVARLVEQLATLEVPMPPVPENMSPSQAAELMGEISRRVERHIRARAAKASSGDLSISASGGRAALTSLVLRTLQQAYYSSRNIGHSGLAATHYCHFTSPIRRYPDLVCHRALLSAVGGHEHAHRAGELVELGEWTSERERFAMTVERDGDDVARCFALEQALYEGGWEQTFRGEVVGLISAGAFVAFGLDADGREAGAGNVSGEGASAEGAPRKESSGERPADSGGSLPVYEGMLPVRRMAGPAGREWWEINEQNTILRGERTGATLRLGDPIEVRVARVDTIRGRVDLIPAV